ncbi:MAG: Gfo/Idh/MocA family oxidoreductase [Clostridia bacterium]|nr:Gfo/Idh/MocA family oxidoreductase [Clostridia bacterium]
MKKLKCAVLGYGGRGEAYSEYALIRPDELQVTAVIDVNPFALNMAKEKFNLKDENLYLSLDEFIAKRVECDFVINATMDELHYSTSIKLLNAGYNMLLEKPVTANPEELMHITNLAKEKNLTVLICHVLRYTPFYRKVKEIIDSGEIGKIISMEINEHIWHGHFVNAFVRGKWNNEKACGSGLLLAKCCHDTDLLCWLNNATRPKEVASFGNRSFYCPENAPKNSTENCYDCPAKDECLFDAYKFELKLDCCPRYTYCALNKPLDEITEEEKIEYLKTSKFGRCVYKTDMDIVDKQTVSVNFENGSVATHMMTGGATKAGRKLHIVCEYGEIEGDLEASRIVYRKFNKDAINYKYIDDEHMYTDTVINTNSEINVENTAEKGHYGGDYYIMKDLVRLLNGEKVSASSTTINDSIDGHYVVYAAEKSRKERRIVSISEI